MPQTFLLGMNAKIYQGAAGASGDAFDDLTELSNVKDVTLNLEAGEADATTRANGGWRATASTLRECSAEFQMLWKPSDQRQWYATGSVSTNAAVPLQRWTGPTQAGGSPAPGRRR